MAVLPLLTIVDITKSKFKGESDKLIWVLVVVLLNPIGSILYFLVAPSQKLDSSEDLESYLP